MNVEGARGRGRGRKTWQECVNDDMRKLRLTREGAQDRAGWRRAIVGKRLTPVNREEQT